MASYFVLSLLVVAAVADPLRHKRQATEELIVVAGAAAAEGSGWAADNHAEAVIATGIPGSSGWGSDSPGVPASILISSQGVSEVGNAAEIQEITANDGQGNLLGAQNIEVDQVVLGENQLAVDASGQDVALASASDAIAQGQGSSAAAGTLDILVQPLPGAGWGMAKP